MKTVVNRSWIREICVFYQDLISFLHTSKKTSGRETKVAHVVIGEYGPNSTKQISYELQDIPSSYQFKSTSVFKCIVKA